MRRLAVPLLVLAAVACSGPGERLGRRSLRPDATPLDRYVHAPDSAYSFERVHGLEGEGCVGHVIRMTSQTWLTPAEVDRTIWWHWLTIVEPEHVGSDVALLYIRSGRNDDPPPDAIQPDLARIAVSTHTVVAELRMVPNQPLAFTGDDAGPRMEDRLIAYGWDRFLRGGGPSWLARLPMTKSAVRAMDTITAFFAEREEPSPGIERFVVAGASKRGWTTWTTAAVDDRVVAIIPIVIDLLNLEVSFQHHFRAYGFWAPAIQAYVDMGIPKWFGTPEMRSLREIVDPYEYRSRFTMPKFLINAAGDQFFVPDSAQFYYHDLPGEKHLRYVPNTGHSLRKTDAQQSLLAFYRSIVTDTPRPDFSWTLEPDGAIRVRNEGGIDPSEVRLWQVSNPEARDFRIDTTEGTWTDTVLRAQTDGAYVGRAAPPTSGWTAFFVELTYPSGGEEPFKFTTEVRVAPDTFPFPFEER